MYALQDAGLAISALPPPQPVSPTGQLEERTVEATEHGSLEDNGRFGALYNTTSAVLQLVESSAERFAELLESRGDAAETTTAAGSDTGPDLEAGQQVDVYG